MGLNEGLPGKDCRAVGLGELDNSMAWGRQHHRRLWLIALGLAMALGLAWPVPQWGPPAFAQTATEPAEQFFADLLVRGQPVFQVGGLPDVSAVERAGQINRRIAALLNQVDDPDPITVNVDGNRNLATLQVNQRVIMTVTEQDALDFDTEVATLAQRWADLLNQAMARTSLAAAVSYRLRSTAEQLVRNTLDHLPALLGALVVLVLTWLLAAAVRHAVLVWASKTEGDRTTEELISRLSYGAVWTLGAVVALGVMGLNFAALLGTLGLTSVAIGFSLRDVLSNYISGVILLATRPFRIGDQIVINNYEGTVTQIQLRATTVQTYDGRLVYNPQPGGVSKQHYQQHRLARTPQQRHRGHRPQCRSARPGCPHSAANAADRRR